jgi:hypothetical protein
VKDYKTEIERVASQIGVEANLIRAIMYMETTRGGHYGTVAELIGISNSILPMNINVDFWGNTFGSSAELEIPLNNILAGAKLLKEIIRRLPAKASVAEVATMYNDLGARQVTDYGARAQTVYNSRIWSN